MTEVGNGKGKIIFITIITLIKNNILFCFISKISFQQHCPSFSVQFLFFFQIKHLQISHSPSLPVAFKFYSEGEDGISFHFLHGLHTFRHGL